jgi:hypothetical protein
MGMSKRHFIQLADIIRNYNKTAEIVDSPPFIEGQIFALADFCQSQNPRFDRERWLGYIAGTNGPSGGEMMSEGYNGWENYQTWNVALWIGNDEGFYELGKEARNYADFVARIDAIEETRLLLEIGAPLTRTPDGVAWNDSGLDTDALDNMIEAL